MSVEKKNLSSPDKVHDLAGGKGCMRSLHVGGATIGHTVVEPGFRWTEAMRPEAGTELCAKAHTGFVVSGSLGVKLEGGEEATFTAGDAFFLPPNHDSWTVGDQPCVMVEFHGAAKPQ
jgi:uncharacterized protein YaiE (UPF0345 family)